MNGALLTLRDAEWRLEPIEELSASQIYAVTWLDDSPIVAGCAVRADGTRVPTVWRQEVQTLDWDESALPGDGEGCVGSLRRLGDALFALGVSGANPGIWSSREGVTWVNEAPDAAGTGAALAVDAAERDGVRVAVGYGSQTDGSGETISLWRSP
jgi:hypothetical protein